MSDTQLRIGMIGVTGRGGLRRRWHRPQGRSVIVAGADINPNHLEAFRHEHGSNPFATSDYRELLARPDIDAIAVTSPDDCHEEHAVAALGAGKHVFCEKPLAITIEGCDHILQAWKKSGARLMIGFNMILQPGLSPSAVAQYWIGNRKPVVEAVRHGRDVIVSPFMEAYLDRS